MNKILDRLRSDRPLVGGAFGRIAEELGFDRAVVRIAGFLILSAVPYLLGASFRAAWIFSILSYVALMIFVRRLDRFGSRLDRKLFRRWRITAGSEVGPTVTVSLQARKPTRSHTLGRRHLPHAVSPLHPYQSTATPDPDSKSPTPSLILNNG
jgi:phage shock protein PspC (stress-responsive transcriptional regulator)